MERLDQTIANPDNQWQPGQQANILLPVKAKTDALTLPVDAVIRDGKGTHVWIEKEKGKFRDEVRISASMMAILSHESHEDKSHCVPAIVSKRVCCRLVRI